MMQTTSRRRTAPLDVVPPFSRRLSLVAAAVLGNPPLFTNSGFDLRRVDFTTTPVYFFVSALDHTAGTHEKKSIDAEEDDSSAAGFFTQPTSKKGFMHRRANDEAASLFAATFSFLEQAASMLEKAVAQGQGQPVDERCWKETQNDQGVPLYKTRDKCEQCSVGADENEGGLHPCPVKPSETGICCCGDKKGTICTCDVPEELWPPYTVETGDQAADGDAPATWKQDYEAKKEPAIAGATERKDATGYHALPKTTYSPADSNDEHSVLNTNRYPKDKLFAGRKYQIQFHTKQQTANGSILYPEPSAKNPLVSTLVAFPRAHAAVSNQKTNQVAVYFHGATGGLYGSQGGFIGNGGFYPENLVQVCDRLYPELQRVMWLFPAAMQFGADPSKGQTKWIQYTEDYTTNRPTAGLEHADLQDFTDSSLAVYDDVASLLSPNHVTAPCSLAMGGFSQGGLLSLKVAAERNPKELAHPCTLTGAAGFSTFFHKNRKPDEPVKAWKVDDELERIENLHKSQGHLRPGQSFRTRLFYDKHDRRTLAKNQFIEPEGHGEAPAAGQQPPATSSMQSQLKVGKTAEEKRHSAGGASVDATGYKQHTYHLVEWPTCRIPDGDPAKGVPGVGLSPTGVLQKNMENHHLVSEHRLDDVCRFYAESLREQQLPGERKQLPPFSRGQAGPKNAPEGKCAGGGSACGGR
ncbi:unnamed protein product [Amoebophrya sp. A120]|nr:unnamed protein product [Amoebophrya sp. A120]|eukprot:GSA120T00009793001.1